MNARHNNGNEITLELCEEKHHGVDKAFENIGIGFNRIYWFGGIAVTFISGLLLFSMTWAKSSDAKASTAATALQVQEAKDAGYRIAIDTKFIELTSQIGEVKSKVEKMATAEKQDEMLRELRNLKTSHEIMIPTLRTAE
jgi:hypothetical protein